MATEGEGGQAGSGAEGWLHARLIPTYGIRSQDEQEKRATACLLAVMHGVPEFGHALLGELAAPKSPSIDTFAEVRFKDAEGKTDIPDGAIVCERGGKRWTCLVEVKTGSATLKDEQVGRYLDIARDQGLDGVLTISNQITHSASERLSVLMVASSAGRTTIRVPDAIGDMGIRADLKSRQTALSVDVSAPHGRTTQVSNQLAAASVDRGVA